MLIFPNIDPVALQIGPLRIYWYGIMYLISFALAFWLCVRKGARLNPSWTSEQVVDLLFYVAIGAVFGGTIGEFLFYEPRIFIDDPLRILRFWEAGRSFHGGLMGVLIAMAVFAKVYKRHFVDIGDFITPVIPIGLAFGRLGNFINGELWGRVTDSPWGMVFPRAGLELRHPSQLYECLLEGVLLFIILQWYTLKKRPRGFVSALFLIGYGLARFIVEFFREPEVNDGIIALGWLTKGQALCLPMILVGIGLLLYGREQRNWR